MPTKKPQPPDCVLSPRRGSENPFTFKLPSCLAPLCLILGRRFFSPSAPKHLCGWCQRQLAPTTAAAQLWRKMEQSGRKKNGKKKKKRERVRIPHSGCKAFCFEFLNTVKANGCVMWAPGVRVPVSVRLPAPRPLRQQRGMRAASPARSLLL